MLKRYKEKSPVKNNTGVIFLKKDKNKDKKNAKRIIDLTSYITPDAVQSDTEGWYTGVTEKSYYTHKPDEPVQDADDL